MKSAKQERLPSMLILETPLSSIHDGPAVAEAGPISIPLESFSVSLPEEPIKINGKPYDFEIDQERIIRAVQHFGHGELINPTGLVVKLGESLPSYLSGVDNDRPHRSYRLARRWKKDRDLGGIIDVVIPSEINKSDTPDVALVDTIEESMNSDVKKAFAEMQYMQRQMAVRRLKFIGGLALFGSTGEGLAVTASNNAGNTLPEHIINGGFGLVGGMAAFAGLALGKGLFNRLRHGNDTAFLLRNMDKHVKKELPKIGTPVPNDAVDYDDRKKEEKIFNKPIIKLVPKDGHSPDYLKAIPG